MKDSGKYPALVALLCVLFLPFLGRTVAKTAIADKDNGKDQTAAQQSQPNSPSNSDQQNIAKIYIYRIDYTAYEMQLKWNDPPVDAHQIADQSLREWALHINPVYLGKQGEPKHNQKKIAGLRRNRYFVLNLPPGKYGLRTPDMIKDLEMEVVAGGVYYLRLYAGSPCESDMDEGPCLGWGASLEITDAEKGREDIRDVWPIAEKDIVDRKLASVPPFLPDTYHPKGYEKHK